MRVSCEQADEFWAEGRGLDKIGIQVGPEIKVILMEADEFHPFVQEELMMPILPLVRVKDVDMAIDMAVRVEHGFRHTAIMHSRNVEKLTKMGKLIQTTILPSFSLKRMNVPPSSTSHSSAAHFMILKSLSYSKGDV